ncbi:MAG: DNA methylase, partial [Clostridia bacterium]|nr:DNA methylase [Clostridia bacterium]
INLTVNHLLPENDVKEINFTEQMDIFSLCNADETEQKKESLAKERKLQETVIDLKLKYGKNAVLKGTNLQEGATAKERNRQIGGHKA